MLVSNITQLLLRNLEDILRSDDKKDFIYNLIHQHAPYYINAKDSHPCDTYVLNAVGDYLYFGSWYSFDKVSTSDIISLIRLIIEPISQNYESFLTNNQEYITNISNLKQWNSLINKKRRDIMGDFEVRENIDAENNGLNLFDATEMPEIISINEGSIGTVNYRKEIAEALKQNPKGLHVNDIAKIISNIYGIAANDVLKKVQSICASDVKKKSSDITRVLNPKTNKPKKGWYRYVIRKGSTIKIAPTNPVATLAPNTPTSSKMATTFEGKAGECAVMSELLWRDYNVNTFLVDDGVDIVASKNNMFYLLQVKTTKLASNRVSIRLNNARFTTFTGFNIRYIIVIRSQINNIDTNLFFIFNTDDINRFINQKRIKAPTDTDGFINVKIKFVNNTPIIYDTEEEDISYYMNKWTL